MAMMTRAAVKRSILDYNEGTRILNTIAKNNLPVHCPFGASEMAKIAAIDKKAAAADITVILPERICIDAGSGKRVFKMERSFLEIS